MSQFFPDIEESSYRTRAVRGGTLSTLVQLLGLLLQTGSQFFLMALLAPAAFGIVAMAQAFVNVANALRDFGLVAAAIQAKKLTHDEASNLFWINLGVSFLLAGLVCAAAYPLSLFYNEPRVLNITLAFSLPILFTGLSAQHRAILTRNLEYSKLYSVQAMSMSAMPIVSVTLAYFGFGYWALVAGVIAAPLVELVSTYVRLPWKPSFYNRSVSISGYVKFGASVSLSGVIGTLRQNVDNLLIGRYFGEGVLGNYKKAYDLSLYPASRLSGPLGAVIFPILSRMSGNDERFASAFERFQAVLAVVVVPFLCVLISGSDWFFGLFGPEWLPSAPIFSAMGISAVMSTIATNYSVAFRAKGKASEELLYVSIAAGIAIVVIFVAAPRGPFALALALAAYSIIIRGLQLWFAKRHLNLAPALFFRPLLGPFLVGLAVVGFSLLLRATEIALTDIGKLIVTFVFALLALAAYLRLTADGRRRAELMRELSHTVRTRDSS